MIKQEGLYGKFILRKTDGSPIDPKAKYLVLRYDSESKDGRAARQAILAYAEAIKETNPTFSKELVNDVQEEGLA